MPGNSTPPSSDARGKLDAHAEEALAAHRAGHSRDL
jgi:hypothetical protein